MIAMAKRICLGGLDRQPCRRLCDGPRCPEHAREVKRDRYARQDARRPNPTARGLDSAHRRQVAAMKAAYVAEYGALPTHCPCGRAITPSNPWSGEHDVPRVEGGQTPTSLRCLACNSARGGQLAAQRRAQAQAQARAHEEGQALRSHAQQIEESAYVTQSDGIDGGLSDRGSDGMGSPPLATLSPPRLASRGFRNV